MKKPTTKQPDTAALNMTREYKAELKGVQAALKKNVREYKAARLIAGRVRKALARSHASELAKINREEKRLLTALNKTAIRLQQREAILEGRLS
jgi:hypothetical protein